MILIRIARSNEIVKLKNFHAYVNVGCVPKAINISVSPELGTKETLSWSTIQINLLFAFCMIIRQLPICATSYNNHFILQPSQVTAAK